MKNTVYKLHLTVLSVFMFFAISAKAQSGSITFLRYSWNEMTYGEKCLCAHFKVNAVGLKGKEIKVSIYLEHPKGTGVPDLNGRYKTTDGYVANTETSISDYDNCVWNDFDVHLPYSEMHPLSGTRTYYIRALLWYGDKVLASTYCDAFSYTKPEAQYKTIKVNTCTTQSYSYARWLYLDNDGRCELRSYRESEQKIGRYYIDEYNNMQITWNNGYRETAKIGYDYNGKLEISYNGNTYYEKYMIN